MTTQRLTEICAENFPHLSPESTAKRAMKIDWLKMETDQRKVFTLLNTGEVSAEEAMVLMSETLGWHTGRGYEMETV